MRALIARMVSSGSIPDLATKYMSILKIKYSKKDFTDDLRRIANDHNKLALSAETIKYREYHIKKSGELEAWALTIETPNTKEYICWNQHFKE